MVHRKTGNLVARLDPQCLKRLRHFSAHRGGCRPSRLRVSLAIGPARHDSHAWAPRARRDRSPQSPAIVQSCIDPRACLLPCRASPCLPRKAARVMISPARIHAFTLAGWQSPARFIRMLRGYPRESPDIVCRRSCHILAIETA